MLPSCGLCHRAGSAKYRANRGGRRGRACRGDSCRFSRALLKDELRDLTGIPIVVKGVKAHLIAQAEQAFLKDLIDLVPKVAALYLWLMAKATEEVDHEDDAMEKDGVFVDPNVDDLLNAKLFSELISELISKFKASGNRGDGTA